MKHNFERIVGTKTADEHGVANTVLEENFHIDFSEKEMKCAAEITKEHQEIVQGVVAHTRKLLASLGVDRPIPKLKFILVDKQKAVATGLLGKNATGTFFPWVGAIAVADTGDLAEFTETFTHEYLHTLGYSSAQVKDGGDVSIYRNGLSMYDRDGTGIRYFGDLEEAVVTELSMKVLQSAPEASIGSAEVQAELAHMNTFRNWFNQSDELKQYLGKGYEKTSERVNSLITISHIERLILVIEDNTFTDIEKAAYVDGFLQNSDTHIKNFPYAKEREKLWILINDIADKETSLSPDQIFDEFAKAHFSGNYLTIARLIEKTYGEGSFRALAHATKKVRT